MGTRRKSREIALHILYQIDVGSGSACEALDLYWENFKPNDELKGFCALLVEGVCAHRDEIDGIIKQYSEHWRLGRMTLVDRNILRAAIFELLFCQDIPPRVTLNEAIELGKKFGSEKSGPFINGILDRITNESAPSPVAPA